MFRSSTKKQNRTLLGLEDRKKLRVFATTVIRGSKQHELTGYLLEIDWQKNQVIEKIPIPIDSEHPFWNARGGNRGGRGLFAYGGILYVATALSILKFNRNLKLVGEIVHPHLAGLHEIFVDKEGIWLTSTVHDLLIKLDFDGNAIDEWWGSESMMLQSSFGFTGRPLNLDLNFSEENYFEEYDQYCHEEVLHINTVWVQNEAVYAFASRKKSLIRIKPQPEKIIFQDNQLQSPHNGILMPDNRVIVNDTQNQRIRLYDIQSGKLLKTIPTSIYKRWIRGSSQFARAGWQRGLAHVKDFVFLVGTSPATIFEVDVEKGVVGQICKIDKDVRHCIHGLTVTNDF